MSGRVIATLAAVVLAAAACTSSSPRADEPAATGEGQTGETETAPASGSSEAPEPVTRKQWLARYALWVTDLRVALENAGTARHVRGRPAEVSRLSGEVAAERDAALAELRDCRRQLRELGDPPRRLGRAARLLARACTKFARGSALEARAARYALAFAAWSRASELVRQANALLPTRQPTERLPLPVGGGVADESRIEPLFSEVANRIAAPAAQVRCWAEPEWTRVKKEIFGGNPDIAGFASHDAKRAGLAIDICRWLALLAYTGARPTDAEQLDVAFAVAALMHESGHLNETGDFYGAGRNEPLAECWAMQHIRQGARALGAERAYANELAERYWVEIYPHRPAGYRTPRCHDGGAYDERPGSSVWP